MGGAAAEKRSRPRSRRRRPRHWWHDQVYPWVRTEVAIAATAATMLTAVVMIRRWTFSFLDGGILNREIFADASKSPTRQALNSVIDTAIHRVTGQQVPHGEQPTGT